MAKSKIDYDSFARRANGDVQEYSRLVDQYAHDNGLNNVKVEDAVVAWNKSQSEPSGSSIGRGNNDSSYGGIKDILNDPRLVDSGGSNEFPSILAATNVFWDANEKRVKSAGEIISGTIKMALKGLGEQLLQEADLLEEINTKGGMAGALSREFRKEIWDVYPAVLKMGIGFDDLKRSMSQLLSDSGRFKLVSSETIESLAATSKAFFNSLQEGTASIEQFQKVSLGASDAMKVIDEAALKSLSLGLNARKTTETLVSNIGKLNLYGFEKGTKGLADMVQKAQALRMDLKTSFDLAEKVMDPTDALSLSANLQVIGGALGDFNDPIKMMWMATNNVEGLQTALAGSLETLTNFNSESGRFEITGTNLRRLRAIQKETGIGFEELSNIAVNASQRTAAATEMMSSGLQFDNEEDKEFLTNLAQMKDGKMVIEVPDDLRKQLGMTAEQKNLELSSIEEGQKATILKFRDEFKEMSAKDVVVEQASAVKNMDRNVAFLAAKARVEMSKTTQTGLERLGIDPRELSSAFSVITNKGGKIIEGVGEGVRNFMKGTASAITPQVKIEKERAIQNSTTESSKTTTVNHVSSGKIDIVVSGPASVDAYTRELRNSQENLQKLKGNYYNLVDHEK